MAILIFIIVLAILILAHEFGHFLFAKLSKMRVDEFGIGFPPKLFSKKYGETDYSVNLIPFGGFVKIFGENGEDGVPDERSFVSKKKPVQILVLAGGVLFNLLLAWILISSGFLFGMPVSEADGFDGQIEDPRFLIIGVSENSPAEKAGLNVGDEIVSLLSNSTKLEGADLTPESFQEMILAGAGSEVVLEYKDSPDSEVNKVSLIPSYDVVPDRPVIGVSTDKIGIVKLPIFSAIWRGLSMTASVFVAVVVGLFTLITDAVRGGADLSQVTGPIGIVGFISDASTLGFVYLLSFTAFISINLAVINLIPFPALDGGRILFVIIEAFRGKPLSAKYSNALNIAGFLILMALMIVVTYNDIAKLIQ